jgi:hypothetical protein
LPETRFVRRLVFREADVAVDSGHTLPGRQSLELIGLSEFVDQVVNKALKGLTRLLIRGPVLLEPGFVVVLLQGCDEAQGRAEVDNCVHCLSYAAPGSYRLVQMCGPILGFHKEHP